MGWFNKNKKEDKKEEIQKLPELPKLPELSSINEKIKNSQEIHQLPSFPNNSFGEKFSQNSIKNAVTGEKEERDILEEEDFEKETSKGYLKKSLIKEIPEEFENAAKIVKKNEPVFIRIDKFEESLHTFEKTKKQIYEIEKMLKDIKKIKDDEEKELEFWENEIISIKKQIEKVDRDIFSRVE
jgi:hypothetical protein